MKRIFKIILLVATILLGFMYTDGFFEFKKTPVGASTVDVDKVQMRKDVVSLSSLDADGENSLGVDERPLFIQKRFKDNGCDAVMQEYLAEGNRWNNVICRLGPKDGKPIVIGAHFDVYEEMPGADDNSSGVAGLLELTRLLKANEKKLTRPVELVAYNLEEPPYFRTEHMGSAHHAKSLKNKKIDIEFMISLEMIGFFTDEKDSQKYPSKILEMTYPDTGDFIAVVGRIGQGSYVTKAKQLMIKNGGGLKVEKLIAPKSMVGVDFSDHLNYWDHDFNAIMITDTAFYRNPNYHRMSDTVETLDFDRMAQVVQGVYGLVLEW